MNPQRSDSARRNSGARLAPGLATLGGAGERAEPHGRQGEPTPPAASDSSCREKAPDPLHGQQVAFEFVDAEESLEDNTLRRRQDQEAAAAASRADSSPRAPPLPPDLSIRNELAVSGGDQGKVQSGGPEQARERHEFRAGCWPFRASQVSCGRTRVADGAQAASGLGSREGGRRQQARSESLLAELRKIEMHEKLLLSNQKKLFSDLNQELSLLGRLTPEPGGGGGGGVRDGDEVALPVEGPGMADASAAIECRDLSYQAGLGPLQKTILHGVSLSVPEGSIYGLLGPSGCGKTTMLRCVAGRLAPSAGSIRVFGYAPGEPGSRIPGPAIGYMPQEISVYEDFTICETLTYFGRINRMRPGVLRARIDFLLGFLNLPYRGRLIKTLSGGQKRRVSLAVALIHSPPLLILDEPTVGVDPLLRQIIWKYLVTLATTDRITIVITTHYIEEARQASIVGLMRAGRMLAEDRPQALMASYQQASLENVFLRLCLMTRELEDDEQQGRGVQVAGHGPDNNSDGNSGRGDEPATRSDGGQCEVAGLVATPNVGPSLKLRAMERGQKYAPSRVDWTCWLAILWTVTWKNYLRLKRNPPVLMFEFILPAFQALLFCLCIGGDPFDIPLAIVNEESVPQASRLFLNSISKTTFNQIPYDNLSAAIQSVESGHTWAAVHIPESYTRNLNERLLHPADVTNETISNGTIQIYPDLTNLHLALTIQDAFRDAFEKFAHETLELFGYDTQLAELPVRVARPIYGSLAKTTSGYLEFMAPGVIISITYVMATGLTALAFVLEKRDGLLERSQVSGVTTTQILLAHALLQVFVMVFQIALVLAVTFYAFKIPSRGPFTWVVLLVLLQGCTGMAFGLLISAVCNEENTAVMLLVGTFYINLILAGIIWPVEAMPKWLRLFSYAQPQTLPTEGLRNILSRGWSIDEPSIQYAFVITIGWLVVFLLGAGLCMRYIK